MPITYRIFPEADILYADWVGVLSVAEITENFRSYVRDPLYRAGRPELIDLTRLENVRFQFRDATAFLSEVNAQPFPAEGGTHTVVLAPGKVAWGLSRMFGTLASLRKGIRMESHHSEMAALAALGRPERTVDAFLAAVGANAQA